MKKSIKFIVLLFCLLIFVRCGDKFPPTRYTQFINNTENNIKIIFHQDKEDNTFVEDSVFIESNNFYKKRHCDPIMISRYHYIDLYLNNVFFKRYNGYEYWSSEEKSLYNKSYYVEEQPHWDNIVYTYTFLPEDFE